MFDAWDGKYWFFFLALTQIFLQSKITNLKVALYPLFSEAVSTYKQYSTEYCAIMTLKLVSLHMMKLRTYQAIHIEKE